MSPEAKCNCQHCEGHIAFPLELAGETVECPHCKCNTLLSIRAADREGHETNLDVYLNIKDEQRGPYDKAQILSMWNNGIITSDSLYWHEGMEDWKPASAFVSKLNASTSPGASSQMSPTPPRTRQDADVANLFILANAAADANNQTEAQKYYTQILERDPTNADAWFGKGRATGWMSTIKEIKSLEIIAAFSNAVKYAPSVRKQEFEAQCAASLLQIAKVCHNLNAAHLKKFIQVGNTWPQYIGNLNLLLALLDYAHSCAPEDKEIISSIIAISEDTIRTFSFSPDRLGLLQKTFKMPAEYIATTQATIENYKWKLQTLG